MNITVEKHLHKWNNVSARKHFVLVSNENATTYSRNSKEPKTIKEALKMEDAEQWKEAIGTELQALIDMGTWKLVPLPKGRKAVGCRMVLKRKFNLDGTVSRWKARAVLKGYAQRKGIDYEETFAPVGKLETFRYMAQVANSKDWNLRQIDFKNAFLNAPMDKELYMELPPGLEFVMDVAKLARGTVCKLVRGLYGAKQSPALWNRELDTYLRSLGFIPSASDACLYKLKSTDLQKGSFSPFSKGEQLPKEGKAKPQSQFKKGHKNKKKGAASKIKATFRNRNAHSVYILAYVDDCVVTGGSSGAIEAVIDRIKTDYKVDDLGELHHFLGMEVIRDRPRRTLEININRYIQDVLERFAMSNANGKQSPMNASNLSTKKDCPDLTTPEGKAEAEAMKARPYRELLGSLLWIHRTGGPSIAYAVHHLCMFANNPSEKHWKQAQHVLKYLKYHVDNNDGSKQVMPLGIKYTASKNQDLEGFVDASFADNYGTDDDNRRSTTGWCFMSGGGAISWKAQKQSTVATSTAEAEYIAAFEAAKEAVYLTRLGQDLDVLPPDYCVPLHDDSQACIRIAGNPCLAERTKHFDVKYHWLREKVKANKVELRYVSTHEQLADIFTKPLGVMQHNYLKGRLTGFR